MGTHECWASVIEPAEHSSLRRHPVGHCPLLGAIAEYPHQAPLLVEVSEVEATELGDAYPGGVQQLDGCMITQLKRIRLSGATLRGVQCGRGLVRMQYRGQGTPRPWRNQPRTRVVAHHTGSRRPGGEGAGCRRAPRQRAAPVSGSVLRTQPAAQ